MNPQSKRKTTTRNIMLLITAALVVIAGGWFINANNSQELKGQSVTSSFTNNIVTREKEAAEAEVADIREEGRLLRDKRLRIAQKYEPVSCDNVESYYNELVLFQEEFETYLRKLSARYSANLREKAEVDSRLAINRVIRTRKRNDLLKLKRVRERLYEIIETNLITHEEVEKTLEELRLLIEECADKDIAELEQEGVLEEGELEREVEQQKSIEGSEKIPETSKEASLESNTEKGERQ